MFVYLVSTGILTGFLSSFFGVGGGILAVPALYWIFPSCPVKIVIGSSLGMVLINSFINLHNFYRANNTVHLYLAFFMGIIMVIGVISSSLLLVFFNDKTIKLLLSLFLFLTCLRSIIFFVDREDKEKKFDFSKVSFMSAGVISLLAGSVSGITGLGGGVILIPMFAYFLNFPLLKIPVYCNFCMFLGSLGGVITYMLLPVSGDFSIGGTLQYFQIGNVNWGISLSLGLGGLISSWWGVTLHRKISAKTAKIIFIVFLMLVSIKVFMDVM